MGPRAAARRSTSRCGTLAKAYTVLYIDARLIEGAAVAPREPPPAGVI